MENFTDLFNEDLSGLESLGDFGGFGGAPGPGHTDGREADPSAMMSGAGQQYGQASYGAAAQHKGYGDQYGGQFRGPAPTGQAGQPYYGGPGGQAAGYQSAPGSNIRMGGYQGGPTGAQMMGGMGAGGGQYPGYQQQGGAQMYGMDQMMSQGGGPNAWGQNAYGMQQQQYRPGGAMPNGPPQSNPAYRQQHPTYPATSDPSAMNQQMMGYTTGQTQSAGAGQTLYPSASQMSASATYPTRGGQPMPPGSQSMAGYHQYPQQQQQKSSQQFSSRDKCYKTFCPLFVKFHNRLQWLSMASFFPA